MSHGVIVVRAAYDAEASVWHVESSDIEGLNLEGGSLEDLLAKLPGAVGDLLEEAGGEPGADAAIELIAHASTRVRLSANGKDLGRCLR